ASRDLQLAAERENALGRRDVPAHRARQLLSAGELGRQAAGGADALRQLPRPRQSREAEGDRHAQEVVRACPQGGRLGARRRLPQNLQDRQPRKHSVRGRAGPRHPRLRIPGANDQLLAAQGNHSAVDGRLVHVRLLNPSRTANSMSYPGDSYGRPSRGGGRPWSSFFHQHSKSSPRRRLMKNDEIIRAWRDADYFFDLSDEQRALLPANQVGMIELSQDALTTVAGGATCGVSC